MSKVKSKLNEQNEDIKVKYNKYLTSGKAQKVKSTTANDKIRAIRFYEECFKYEDFELFDETRGMTFYNYLRENEKTGVQARIKHLSSLREFFIWYYENVKQYRIEKYPEIQRALDTLLPTPEDIRLNQRITYVDYPTDDEIQKIMDLSVDSVEDKRNRALISYMLLTAARIEAVATITINLIDMKKLLVKQDPLEGTHTKRDKLIYTRFMILDTKYLEYLKEWIEYVTSQISDPKTLLFPHIRTYASRVQVTNEKVDSARYNEIIKKVCKKAGVSGYHPHSFRHYVINKGLERAHNGREIKALSQNIGHWEIETILEQYANMRPEIYSQVIEHMFESKQQDLSSFSTEELLAELQARAKSNKF